MVITVEQMQNAINSGYEVCVLINGEFYEFEGVEHEEKEHL